MTRFQILQDLKAMIGPGSQATDSQLIVWVNDAYSQVIDAILQVNPDFFAKSSTTSSFSGQQEYVLPSDFMKMVMVNIQIDGVWHRVIPFGEGDVRFINKAADETDSQGYTWEKPRYYINGSNLGFMPIPDETTSNNIKMWYTYTPNLMTEDSSVPAIPAQYHNIIKYAAYGNYLDLQREHVAAERMRVRFDALVERMNQNIAERNTDVSKSVQITNDDFYQ